MDKPLLLLDIDGVLNPLCKHCPEGYETRPYVLDGRAFELLLNPAHGPWLGELAEAFELHWATSWEDSANEAVAPLLGLPRLPYVTFPDPSSANLTWKLPTISQYVGDRPCAWVDDDIHRDALLWAQLRPSTLIVTTNPGIGLERAHVDELLSFAAELRAHAAE